MNITAAIVLFSMIWFMVFFVMIPLRMVTQGEAGEVVPGTHSSSPHEHHLGRKAVITTVVSVVLWMLIAAVIVWGPWGVRDLDWFGRMQPAQVR